MSSEIKQFINQLDLLINQTGEYRLMTTPEEWPPVWVLIYRNFPAAGHLTAVTYGLSLIHYPDWTHGRPELIISIEEDNVDWALAMGFLVKSLRGDHAFTYGSVFDFGEKITEDSDMTGFLIFAPTTLQLEECTIKLVGTTINLVELYPLYRNEIELIQKIGSTEFFFREDVNLHDVHRLMVTK